MAAVLLRFRAELRVRWRPWLGLALLVGLSGGAVTALLAGARRTDSAYARFASTQRAADYVVVNYEEDGTALFDFDELARLPIVADSARAQYEYFSYDSPNVASPDGRLGAAVNRFKLLDGRLADPRRADEVVVGFDLARQEHLHVGSRIPFSAVARPGTAAFALLGPDDRRRIGALADAIPSLAFRVVGIVAVPGEFPPQQPTACCVHQTSAFARLGTFGGSAAHPHEVLMVRLRRGSADDAAFGRALERRSGGKPVEAYAAADQASRVEDSIGVQAGALALLGVLLGIVAALVLAQLLARLAYAEADDYPTLDAIGMSRRQRCALGVVRAGVIGGVAAGLAVLVAVAASPLFPTGLARKAETAPGVSLDAAALLSGAVLTATLVVLVAVLPAWLAARVSPRGSADRAEARQSRLAGRLAASGAAPPVVAGAAMAFGRSSGRRSVPVWTSVAAVAIGVGALVAAITYDRSLDRLLRTPRLYGVTWDVGVTNYGSGPPVAGRLAGAARRHAGVRAVAAGDIGFPLRIGDGRVDIVAVDPVEGDALPPVVAGRRPVGAREIALGSATMHELGVGIGDSVAVRTARGATRDLAVVGRAVLPPGGVQAGLGTGAYVTVRAATALYGLPPKAAAGMSLYLRVAPGTDVDRVVGDLQGALCRPGEMVAGRPEYCQLTATAPPTPDDIVNFGRVRRTPLLLGGLLSVLALGTLAQVLVTAVRRRRRDLAIYKTLGFTRSQVRASVATQATYLAGIALLLGVPVGLAAGRLLWSRRADDLGIVNEAAWPWLALALAVPIALGVANVVAFLPARAAARTRPAVVLRSE